MSLSVFDHPWLGGLFGDEELGAILSAEAQLGHMLAIEAAHLRLTGSGETGDPGEPGDLAASAAAIEAARPRLDALRRGTARDGVVVPALVAELRAVLEGAARARLHKGMTSQDVIDTALVMALQQANGLLDARLVALAARLDGVLARWGAVPLLGRTRMQAALPITVAGRVAGWRRPLNAHRARLAQLRPRLERLQLGGAVGQGYGDGDVAAGMAAALGLEPGAVWQVTRDGIAEYAGWLSLVSGTIGKMGQDICLMAQQGLDEIAIAGGGGSSAMAHKQNPVLAELLVTLARFNAVQIGGLHQALIHEQERSGAAWALEWMILPQMVMATGRSLTAATELAAAITRIGAPQ